MRKMIFVWILAPCMLAGCSGNEAGESSETASKKELAAVLQGTWESVTINVKIHSMENTDSTAYFSIPEESWKDVYLVKPPRMFFEADKKYRREHRNFQDSLISMSRGIWNVFGDTLMMIEPDATYQYRVRQADGLITFFTLLDWDGDGVEDDEYEEVKRKVGMGMGK